ncbi:hypothetical protein [Paenibacillus sp. 22594]|uniref:hypothetical protein n=1 Tax=Paenibacillus sp. 22594 TaxID=3453947 RepID=UPI003F835450
MSIVSLKKSGLIYYDRFTAPEIDDRWEMSGDTSDITFLKDGGLRIEHGDATSRLFFNPLTETKNFVMDIQNRYNPLTTGDTGGLIVYSNEAEYLAAEEYFDATEGVIKSYPWLRLVRDSNTYSIYWSDDGVSWSIQGITGFAASSPKIGLFLGGASGQPLDVQQVRVYRDLGILLTKLVPGTRVALRDRNDQVVASTHCRTGMTGIKLNISSLPLPFQGKFMVEFPDGSVYESSDFLTLWGGDEYAFEPSADLYFIDSDNQERSLYANSEAFLGLINTQAYLDIKMIIRNSLLTGSLKNVALTLVSYKESDQFSRLVSVANDAGGQPGPFIKSLLFSQIEAGGEYTFWIRVRRESNMDYLTGKDTQAYFGINVTSSFMN